VTTMLQRPRPLPVVGPGDPGRPVRTGIQLRLPVTWPLVTLFLLFPLWWVLGLSALIWPLLAAPMLVALIWRRRTRAPLPIFVWFLFCSWVLMSGLQLGGGTKTITFCYRLLLYAGAGVLFLYVYNMPRSGRLDLKVLHILTTFWMIVVAGGYAGLIGGAHTFPSVIEFAIPHSLRSQPFVQELVQPVFANVENFLGFPDPRPAAPFPYTNNWGGNVALLTPVALAALSATRPGPRRKLIIVFLVASLVPMVLSLNRGMFLSIGVGLLYLAIRLAGRGRVGTLVSLVGFVALAYLIVALTPLGHIITANVSSTHGHSNTTRASVVQQALGGANQSPLFGHGEPQAVTGQGGTPPIGTQGQLWMVLYSNGYVATALFLGFFLAVLWQTRKVRGTAGLWLHAAPLVALAQITVYGWLPAELQVVMVIAALTYRRCLRPGGPDTAPITSASGDQYFLPAQVSAPLQVIHADDRPPQPIVGAQKSAPAGAAAILLRGSAINVVAMVAGAAMSFGLVVLVSRWLQPRGAGALFELIALFTILSNTFELGADTGLTRWISRAKAMGGLSDVRRVVAAAVVPVAVVGVAAAVAVWMTAPQLAQFFLHGVSAREGILAIRIVAPLIPLGALSSCLVDGARGFGRMWPYLLIEGAGKPALRIALVLAVLVAGFGLSAAIIALGLPVIVGLVAAAIIFLRLLQKEAPARSASGKRRDVAGRPGWRVAQEFWAFTGPRAFQATFQIVILWLDILIVGAIASSYAAGVYSAVSKLAIVGTFTLEGNRLAIGPQLSALLARGQQKRAVALFQRSTQWLMLASWPLYLIFMIFPATVLGIFGPRYTVGAPALVVLSLAMLINLGTGNVTVVLLMGGRSTWSAINAGAALAVNIGLNLVLVPRIGILGAAIAWAASIAVDNLTAMAEVWMVMGFDPFGPGYWRAAGITVACFGGPAVVARTLLGAAFPSLCVAVAAGLIAFAIAVYSARAPLQLTEVLAGLGGRTPTRRRK
jgi:O-antigen/teichoic acid export membrane protein